MRVNSPACAGLGGGAGQSPWAGALGIDDWKTRVNSPGPPGFDGRAAGGGSGVGSDGGFANMPVNSLGRADAGAATCDGDGWGCDGGRVGSGAGVAGAFSNMRVNSPPCAAAGDETGLGCVNSLPCVTPGDEAGLG